MGLINKYCAMPSSISSSIAKELDIPEKVVLASISLNARFNDEDVRNIPTLDIKNLIFSEAYNIGKGGVSASHPHHKDSQYAVIGSTVLESYIDESKEGGGIRKIEKVDPSLKDIDNVSIVEKVLHKYDTDHYLALDIKQTNPNGDPIYIKKGKFYNKNTHKEVKNIDEIFTDREIEDLSTLIDSQLQDRVGVSEEDVYRLLNVGNVRQLLEFVIDTVKDPELRVIAETLYDNTKGLGLLIYNPFSNLSNEGAGGTLSPALGYISIDTSRILKNAFNNKNYSNQETLNRYILHEILHAATITKIQDYQDKVSEAVADGVELQEESGDSTVKELISLFEEHKKDVLALDTKESKDAKRWLEIFEDIQQHKRTNPEKRYKFKNKQEREFFNSNINNFYYLTHVYEFISEALTSKELSEKLQIEYKPSGKRRSDKQISIFKRFWNLINKLFNFGKKNSLYSEVYEKTINITRVNNPVYSFANYHDTYASVLMDEDSAIDKRFSEVYGENRRVIDNIVSSKRAITNRLGVHPGDINLNPNTTEGKENLLRAFSASNVDRLYLVGDIGYYNNKTEWTVSPEIGLEFAAAVETTNIPIYIHDTLGHNWYTWNRNTKKIEYVEYEEGGKFYIEGPNYAFIDNNPKKENRYTPDAISSGVRINNTKEDKLSPSVEENKAKVEAIYRRVEPNKTQNHDWGLMKDLKSPFTAKGSVVTTRINGTHEHFGNIFASKEYREKGGYTQEKAIKNYIYAILYSPDPQFKWIREQIRSGELKGKPLIYPSNIQSNGQPTHADVLYHLINNYNWGTPSSEPSTVETNTEVNVFTKPERSEGTFNVEDTVSISEREQINKDFPSYQERKTRSLAIYSLVTKIIDSYEHRYNQQKLANNMEDLSRSEIIEYYGGFNNVVETVRDFFTEVTDEELIRRIESEYDLSDLSEDDRISYLNKELSRRKEAYQKITRNFNTLTRDILPLFTVTEGIEIHEEVADVSEESSPKESWHLNHRETSNFKSLTKEIRRALATLKETDTDGFTVIDDLGFEVHVNPMTAYVDIINNVNMSLTSTDMLRKLEKLSQSKLWLNDLVSKMNKDEVLRTKMFVNFRKDAQNYYIINTEINNNDAPTFKTIKINQREVIQSQLDVWDNNIQTGKQLVPDNSSIYTKTGEIKLDKLRELTADSGANTIRALVNNIRKFAQNDKSDYTAEDSEINTELLSLLESANTMLASFGISSSIDYLSNLYVQDKAEGKGPGELKIASILSNLHTIAAGVVKNKGTKVTTLNDGTKITTSLVEDYRNSFTRIAETLNVLDPTAIEGSSFENGKSYYGYTVPNYMHRLFSKLQNQGDFKLSKEAFMEYLQEEFGKYSWFKKDGEWLNSIFERLEANNGAEGLLDIKSVLNTDKAEYTDWDKFTYSISMFAEYTSIPNSNQAYYYVPILSDSPASEWIRLPKYELTSEGTASQEIKDEFYNIVVQEYDRIRTVRKRQPLIKAGKIYDRIRTVRKRQPLIKARKIKAIKNYDKNGLKFNFLPKLNDYIVPAEYITGLLDILNKIEQEQSNDQVIEYYTSNIKGKVEESTFTFIDFMDAISYFRNEVKGGDILLKDFAFEQVIKDIVIETMDTSFEEIMEMWENEGVLETYDNGQYKYLPTVDEIKIKSKESARDFLYGFFLNNALATNTIYQLTISDLAFYKNMEDVQKRFKQIYSPKSELDTEATWGGNSVARHRNAQGKPIQKVVYIGDKVSPSNVLDIIKPLIESKVEDGSITAIDRDYILSQFSAVNTTDAQAYRSLDSYREIMIMSGNWDAATHERAYNNLKSGKWDMQDFTTIWQTIKPFTFTHETVHSGMLDKEGNPTYIKMGVQHKNSEFLLLSIFEAISNGLGQSNMLTALGQFMEQNNLDVIMFDSAVKTGLQGEIDLSQFDTDVSLNKEQQGQILDYLNEQILVNKDGSTVINNEVVHDILLEDYGIQTSTPEHIIDTYQMVGSQIRRLILSDISDDAIIIVNGTQMTKKDVIKQYHELIVENLKESFKEVRANFANNESLSKALIKEVQKSDRYTNELLKAITLNESGEFSLPLNDPIIAKDIYSLLITMFKNNVTKQKIRGGSLIQVSNFGMTDQLNMVFKDKGGNLYTKDNFEGNLDTIKAKIEAGELTIAHLEVYMPAYSRKFYEPLMDTDANGNKFINPDKKGPDGKPIMDDDLRKLVGYRVPTEDKYSMAPIYIKGFLPQQNGGAIMLPSEITTLSGSDFDVDKLYVMIPEFRVNHTYSGETISRAWEDFYEANPELREQIKENMDGAFLIDLKNKFDLTTDKGNKDYKKVLRDIAVDTDTYNERFNKWKEELREKGVRDYEFVDGIKEEFNRWLETNSRYKKDRTSIYKVNSKEDVAVSDLSRDQRNNKILDTMWGVLTSTDTSHKILNPGNFDKNKRSARINTLLNNITLSQLNSITGVNLTANSTIEVYEKSMNVLENMELDDLAKLVEKYSKEKDPLSPKTQLEYHSQNMVGGAMIGIYANHNTNHSMFQHLLNEDNPYGSGVKIQDMYTFTFDGKKLTELHSIKNEDGEYITENTSQYLASSVDNVKEPTLDANHQNPFTADSTMLLTRLGHRTVRVTMLMNQPIVKEMATRVAKESKLGKSASAIIEEVIDDYINAFKKAELSSTGVILIEEGSNVDVQTLMQGLLLNREGENLSQAQLDKNKALYYKSQIDAGRLFQKVYSVGRDLNKVISNTRYDTTNGAAVPTVGALINKIMRHSNLANSAIRLDNSESEYNKSSAPRFSIVGLSGIVTSDIYERISEEDINEVGKSSPYPMINAFYNFGLNMPSTLIREILPEISSGAVNLLNALTTLSNNDRLSDKEADSILDQYLVYYMSNNYDFLMPKDVEVSGEYIADFMFNFVEEFEKVVRENPDIQELDFINRIRKVPATHAFPLKSLSIDRIGNLNKDTKESLTKEWASLLYHKKPEVVNLAFNLFKYNFYRGGFKFNPNTFIHLAPVEIRESLMGYREAIESINFYEDTNFIINFIRNNLTNSRWVRPIQEIPSVIAENFIDPETGGARENVELSDIKSAISQTIQTGPQSVRDYYHPFISVRMDNEIHYYMNTQLFTMDERENVVLTPTEAYYHKITPLGIKNGFLEYGAYTRDGGKSIVPSNNGIISATELANHLNAVSHEETTKNDALFNTEPTTGNTDNSFTFVDKSNTRPVTSGLSAVQNEATGKNDALFNSINATQQGNNINNKVKSVIPMDIKEDVNFVDAEGKRNC